MQDRGNSGKTWEVITVTYNSVEPIKKYWEVQIPEFIKWTVVDNASSDETVEECEDRGANVIRLNQNVGFSSANNVALSQSSAQFVCFANPDVSINFNDLLQIQEFLERKECIVAPQLQNDDGSTQPNGRNSPYLISKIANRLPFRTRLRDDYLITPAEIGVHNVSWVTGAVVIGRRTTFMELNGWDERFFLYYEDTDLCLRAQGRGIPVLLMNEFRWLHGWKRETKSLRLQPWKFEINSGFKFFKLYPKFLSWPKSELDDNG